MGKIEEEWLWEKEKNDYGEEKHNDYGERRRIMRMIMGKEER